MINKEYIEIQELVEAIIDNRGKTVPTSENGIPLIATNCIKHSSIFPTFENIRYINQETYDNWFRAHLKPNDILFVNKGTPGRCCIVPNPVNFVAAQDMVGLRFKKHLNPYYMLAVLRSKEIQNTIENNHVGLVIAHFRKQELVKLKLPILEETIRNKIGDFYEIISKKIELNNRINAELEAMAKTLYDYWFVQFDFPVSDALASTPLSQQSEAGGKRNNVAEHEEIMVAGGERNNLAERKGVMVAESEKNTVAERSRGYKSSGGKMVYNEILKREVPEGWQVKTVGDFAKIKKGKLITEKTANTNGNIKVVSAGLDFSYYHSEANFPNNTITVSASGANAGYINFWREPIFACDCTTVRGNNDFETFYILQFLKSVQEFIYSQARGSAQPHVYPKDIEALKIIIPNKEILHKYGEIVCSMNEKITNNLKQNQELSALRDWLLPMLINGQVKVE